MWYRDIETMMTVTIPNFIDHLLCPPPAPYKVPHMDYLIKPHRYRITNAWIADWSMHT